MKRFKNKPSGILNVSDLKTAKGQIFYWCMFAILAGTCVFTLLPAVWVVLSGFKDTQEIYSGFSFFPSDMSIGHMRDRLFESWAVLDLENSILNTVIMSLGSLALTLAVCGMGGYVISRLRPRGSRLVLVLVLWTMMMPGQLRMVPLFISWLNFPFVAELPFEVSILDTYWPIWLSAAANAFEVLLFKSYFDSIPISYIEAAKLDGCGNVRTFLSIMLPLSAPIIIYVSIMCLSGAWSNFFLPYLVLQSQEKQVLPVKIFMLKGNGNVKMNTYMMALVYASIPPFLIFVFFQRHIMGGLNLGGVKG